MSQPNQPDLFPELVPPIALRYWRAVNRYFETGAIDPPTRKQVVDQMIANDPDKPASESTIDRACRDFPHLCPKPRDITRYTRPPWETRADLVALKPADAPAEVVHIHLEGVDSLGMPCVVEAVSDEHGLLRLISRLTGLAVAGLGAFALLDSMDGKMDGAIHWCEVLVKLAHAAL